MLLVINNCMSIFNVSSDSNMAGYVHSIELVCQYSVGWLHAGQYDGSKGCAVLSSICEQLFGN